MPCKRKILKKLNPKQWWKATGSAGDPKKDTLSKSKESIDKDESTTEKEATLRQKKTKDHFLRKAQLNRQVALFDRSEIRVGKLLGAGAFCEVFEVTEIRLQSGLERSSYMSESFSSLSERIADATEARRAELARSCTTRDGKPKYALKQIILDTWFAHDDLDSASATLMNEASYLLTFNHPNILKIYGMALDDLDDRSSHRHLEDFFCITDVLKGSLYDRIQVWKQEGKVHQIDHPGNVIRKTKYARDIASALEYLHDRRILYRDLRPQSVGFLSSPLDGIQSVRDQRSAIQLCEFGLCRELPDASTKGAVAKEGQLFRMSRVGSPAYMAPEVLHSDPMYNAKADVYAFAVVYYEMLVLKNSMGALPRFMNASARPDVTKLGLPAGIQDILSSTWHHCASKRSSIQEVSAKIDLVLEELQGAQSGPKTIESLETRDSATTKTQAAKSSNAAGLNLAIVEEV